MDLFSKTTSSRENVRVLLRVRPNFAEEEIVLDEEGQEINRGCIKVVDSQTVKIAPVQIERLRYGLTKMLEIYGNSAEKIDKVFKFDRVFDEDSQTEDVFSFVADTLPTVLDGFTTTILSYGPTFGGKSFTMVGTEREPGIIPKTIYALFKLLEDKNVADNNPEIVTEIEVSYVELHNNLFRNLLRQESLNKAVPTTPKLLTASFADASEVDDFLNPFTERGDRVDLHETPILGSFLVGAGLRVPVHSAEETFDVLRRGESMRLSKASSSIDGSTRSHAIITLFVESKIPPIQNSEYDELKEESDIIGHLLLGKLHLIDLAGGERVDRSKPIGENLLEAQFINKSLLAFGEVLHTLASNASIQKKKSRQSLDTLPPSPTNKTLPELHVPYLDNRLTHFLKDSFGGFCRTVMISNLGPEAENYNVNLHCLQYSARAMKVGNLVSCIRIDIPSHIETDPYSEISLINQLKQKILEPPKTRKIRKSLGSLTPTPRKVISFSFAIHSLAVEDIPYICLPFTPWIQVEIGSVIHKTSKIQYSGNFAKYPESMSFEIAGEDIESGIELDMRVMTKIPFRKRKELGRGKVEIRRAFPILEERTDLEIPVYQQDPVTGEVFNSGKILLAATLRQSLVSKASVFDFKVLAPKKSVTTLTKTSQGPKDEGTVDVKKRVILSLKKISTPDVVVLSDAPTGEMFQPYKFSVEAKLVSDSHKTPFLSGKLRTRNKDVIGNLCFDEPDMDFDIGRESVQYEELHILVFAKVGDNNSTRAIGRAIFPLSPLAQKPDNESLIELSSTIKDVSGCNIGRMFINATLTPSGRDRRGAVEAMSLTQQNSNLPKDMKYGWVKINTVEAIGLNSLKLLGRHVRYEHLDGTPMFDALTKQDLLLFLEYGNKWVSHSPVMSDHEDSCTWEDLDFRFLVSREDFLHDSIRISVFNRKFSGKEGIIGSAILALQQFVSDSSLSIAQVPVKLRSVKNKVNGILHIDGIVIKDAGGEWIPGTVETVHNNGRYDVRYDDGELEQNIGKDFLKLAPPGARNGGGIAWRPPTPRHDKAKYPEGTKVEVRFGSKDVWLPAVVEKVRDNGTYDINSTFDLPLRNVDEASLRLPQPSTDKSLANKTTPSKNNLRFLYAVGDKVEGNFKAKGKWYRATVWKAYMLHELPHYDLDYASGVRESGLTDERIRLYDESKPPSSAFLNSPGKSMFDVEEDLDDDEARPLTDLADLDLNDDFTRGRSRHRSRSPGPAHESRSRSPEEEGKSGHRSRLGRAPSERSLSRTGSHKSLQEMLLEKAGLLVGDRVEVAPKPGYDYKLGTILELLPNNKFNIELDENNESLENISREQIRLLPEELDNVDRVYPFLVGDKVQCNFRGTGDWINGTITKDRGHGVYDIEYDDGRIESKVCSESIRRAAPSSHNELKFAVGDKVEVRSDDLGYWFPAVIRKARQATHTYDIQYPDGEKDIYVTEKLIRPGRNDTGVIPPVRPAFVPGDRVYVKSRSKAFGLEIKAFAEGIRKSDEDIKVLFGLLRTVEEEEAYLQVKRETASKNKEDIKKLNDQINEFDSMNPFLLHHSDLAELHDDFQKIREEVDENHKSLESEDPRISELLKELKADIAKASALVRQRLSMNYNFLTHRSGLGDEELHALTVAIENLKNENEALEKAVKKTRKTISALSASRHTCTEQEKRTIQGKKTGKELVDAMQSAVPKQPTLTAAALTPMDHSASAQNILNRFDSKRSLLDEASSIDFGDIYEGANFEFDSQPTPKKKKLSDNATDFFDDIDQVEDEGLDDSDEESIQEPDIDLRKNTGLGGLLLSFRDLRAEFTDDASAYDRKKSPTGKTARFANLPTPRGNSKQVKNMHHEVLLPVDQDKGQASHHNNPAAMEDYVASPELLNGNKQISLDFEPKSSVLLIEQPQSAEESFSLISTSPMKEDTRVDDARKNLEEKKARALVAKYAYFKAVDKLKKAEEKCQAAVKDCECFTNMEEIQNALDKKLGDETKLIDKQLQNTSEAKSKAHESRLAAYRSACDYDNKALALFKQQAKPAENVEDTLKKIEECKSAYVVDWSSWEEARFALGKEIGCHHDTYHLNRKKLDALKHLHQLHHKFGYYKFQRKILLKKEQEVLETYKETINYHKDLLNYKEQVESEAAAWEYYNKKVKEMNRRPFGRRSLLSLNATTGNSNSPNSKDSSIFKFDNIDTMTPIHSSKKLVAPLTNSNNKPSIESKVGDEFSSPNPLRKDSSSPLRGSANPARSASMTNVKSLLQTIPDGEEVTESKSRPLSLSIPPPISISIPENNFFTSASPMGGLGGLLGLSLSINTDVAPVPQSSRAMTDRPSSSLTGRHSLTIMINPETGHVVAPNPPPAALPTMGRPNTPRVQADRKALQDIKNKLALSDNYYEFAKLRAVEENKIEELLNEYNKQLVYLNEDDYKIIKTEKRLYHYSAYYTTLHITKNKDSELNPSLSLIPPTSSMYNILVNLNNIINENYNIDTTTEVSSPIDYTTQEEEKQYNNDNIQLIANNQETLLFDMISDINYLNTSIEYIEKSIELRNKLLAILKKVYNAVQFSIECCKSEYKAYHTSIQSIHNELDANSNTVKSIINAHRLHSKYIAKIKKLLFILLLNNQEISSLETSNKEKESYIVKEQMICNHIIDTIQALQKNNVSITDNPVINQINNLLIQVDEIKGLIGGYKKSAIQCDNNIAGLDVSIREVALNRLEEDFITNWEEDTQVANPAADAPASNISTNTLQNTETNSIQYTKVNGLLENEINMYNKGILYTKQRVEYLYLINHHMTTLLYLLEQIHVLKEYLLYTLSSSQYKELFNKLHGMVVNMQEQKTNITSQYTQFDTQLKTLKEKLEALQEYIATKMKHLSGTPEYAHYMEIINHDLQEINSLLGTVDNFIYHSSDLNISHDIESDYQALYTNQSTFNPPIQQASKAYEDWNHSVIPFDSISANTNSSPSLSSSHTNLIHLLTNNPEHNQEYIQTLTLLSNGVTSAKNGHNELVSLNPVYETKSGVYLQYNKIANENIPTIFRHLFATYRELEMFVDKEKVKRTFITSLGRLALGNEGMKITNFTPSLYILPTAREAVLNRYSSEDLNNSLAKNGVEKMEDDFAGPQTQQALSHYNEDPLDGNMEGKEVFEIGLKHLDDLEKILSRARRINTGNLASNTVSIMKYKGNLKVVPRPASVKSLPRTASTNSANKLVPALVASIERKTSTKSMLSGLLAETTVWKYLGIKEPSQVTLDVPPNYNFLPEIRQLEEKVIESTPNIIEATKEAELLMRELEELEERLEERPEVDDIEELRAQVILSDEEVQNIAQKFQDMYTSALRRIVVVEEEESVQEKTTVDDEEILMKEVRYL